jgi:protein-S-isoprenylcysteine O-methyltransferase Ste14
MRWLLEDPDAKWLVAGSAIVLVAGEVVATYLGQARDGRRRPLGSFTESVLYARRRDGAPAQDRSTLWIIVLASRVGLLAALLIAARVPALRAGADDWWTLGVGVAMVLAGVGLRAWAIVTLGRYFRRVVTIEPGQTLVRRGPYRLLRHPSYAGILLAFAGLGLALGSWVSAAVALVTLFVGLLPRIRVEERALRQAFGGDYEDYASHTSRVLPHVW